MHDLRFALRQLLKNPGICGGLTTPAEGIPAVVSSVGHTPHVFQAPSSSPRATT
jgi:hypothetical protein